MTNRLSEERKEDGRALLRLAARIGLAPQAAAWLYDHEIGEWRYYLVSPLLHDLGRGAVHEGLKLATEATTSVESMTIVDVYLVRPVDRVAILLQSCSSCNKAEALIRDYEHGGATLDAYLYKPPVDTWPAKKDRKQVFHSFTHKLANLARRRVSKKSPLYASGAGKAEETPSGYATGDAARVLR